jgi:hypothetical protein
LFSAVPAHSSGTSDGRYGWAIVGTLAITETVSWGVLYYAFAIFLTPMRLDRGWSTLQLTGAFSLALAVSALAAPAVELYLVFAEHGSVPTSARPRRSRWVHVQSRPFPSPVSRSFPAGYSTVLWLFAGAAVLAAIAGARAVEGVASSRRSRRLTVE